MITARRSMDLNAEPTNFDIIKGLPVAKLKAKFNAVKGRLAQRRSEAFSVECFDRRLCVPMQGKPAVQSVQSNRPTPTPATGEADLQGQEQDHCRSIITATDSLDLDSKPITLEVPHKGAS
ncbi:hypothetical protein BGX24_004167 [Mortierella sp. AD032]|nr:hypothetical protein BGX24_004167 [Mortierella sp. AD032]